jgi:hypothetical protein
MKNILYLLLLVATFGFGQNGFIEIEVKDSIKVKPLKIEYNIQINDSKFLKYDQKNGVNQDSTKIKMFEKNKELELFLKTKKYNIRPLNNSNFQIHDYIGFWKYGYTVILENSEDLQKLTSEIKNLNYIIGSLGDIEYEESELLEKRLFSKVLKKAKNKATMIAELSGLKLGRIIEFKESKEIDDINLNFMDIYISASQGRKFSMDKNIIFGEKWKTIVVKFEAE